MPTKTALMTAPRPSRNPDDAMGQTPKSLEARSRKWDKLPTMFKEKAFIVSLIGLVAALLGSYGITKTNGGYSKATVDASLEALKTSQATLKASVENGATKSALAESMGSIKEMLTRMESETKRLDIEGTKLAQRTQWTAEQHTRDIESIKARAVQSEKEIQAAASYISEIRGDLKTLSRDQARMLDSLTELQGDLRTVLRSKPAP